MAGSLTPPATAQEGQKIKIKIKVPQEEKDGVPSEYKDDDEDEALKKKKEVPATIPNQRKKEKSHRERAVPINQAKELEKLQ